MRSDAVGALFIILVFAGLIGGAWVWFSNWNECRESFSWLYCFNQWVLR